MNIFNELKREDFDECFRAYYLEVVKVKKEQSLEGKELLGFQKALDAFDRVFNAHKSVHKD